MSEFKSSNFTNEDNSGGPDLVGVTTFTSPYYFVPPSGTTAERPSGDGLAPGMLRFNTDIGRLETWRGDHWATILGESPSLNGGARGVFGGRAEPAITNRIDYITISTLGNAIDFGDMVNGRYALATASSSTRGVFAGGFPANGDRIDYITISSTGDATVFGTLTSARWLIGGGVSSQVRGVFAGGSTTSSPFPIQNVIEYITFASTGSAVDFGDLTRTSRMTSSCSSSTRGLFAGGYTVPSAPTGTNTIDYITISTTGNALDFGDCTFLTRDSAGCSNATRGVIFCGGSPFTNTIQFITIATLGDAQDFGDFGRNTAGLGACSSSTRGVAGGGLVPGNTNILEYITILSTGNSIDFGDLTAAGHNLGALSNAHGGL